MYTNPIPTENQQGFHQSINWPQGIVRRVQVQNAHEEFMEDFPGNDTVMMKILEIETLLRKGEVRTSYFPDDFRVISSGIIHDDELRELRWRQEGYAVEAFGPHYHIPTDYPVYGNMEADDRIANIEKMMEGTRWMHDHLKSTNIRTIPLVKGYTSEERAICYETLRELDISFCAYYGAQYFGGEMGNGINKLNADVREVASELDIDGMLLIGLNSERGLAKFPPEVVAAAGKQYWIEKSRLRDIPMPAAQQRYLQWREYAESFLSEGDSTLRSFMEDSEVKVHG